MTTITAIAGGDSAAVATEASRLIDTAIGPMPFTVWTAEVYELLSQIRIAAPGRHNAPSADNGPLVDDMVRLRDEWWDHQRAILTDLPADWAPRATAILAELAA